MQCRVHLRRCSLSTYLNFSSRPPPMGSGSLAVTWLTRPLRKVNISPLAHLISISTGQSTALHVSPSLWFLSSRTAKGKHKLAAARRNSGKCLKTQVADHVCLNVERRTSDTPFSATFDQFHSSSFHPCTHLIFENVPHH